MYRSFDLLSDQAMTWSKDQGLPKIDRQAGLLDLLPIGVNHVPRSRDDQYYGMSCFTDPLSSNSS
jgi:hypothetical protein